jgi:hypothetical protein
MDLLLESDSEEIDEILEVTKDVEKSPKRSSFRDKQLLKMYAIREILKWKYNYFESNANEHPLFVNAEKRLGIKIHRKSFAFKKLWRLKMDKVFTK